MQKGLFSLPPGSLGLPLTIFKEVRKEKVVSYSHHSCGGMNVIIFDAHETKHCTR